MVGVYIVIAIGGLVVTVFFVDQLPEDIDPRANDTSNVKDLVLGKILHMVWNF